MRKIKLTKSALLLTAVFYFYVFTSFVAFATGGNIIKTDDSGVGVEFNNKKGQIDEFNLVANEIIIDDGLYAISKETEYFSKSKRLIGSSQFLVGSWVIFNISDSREVLYMQLTDGEDETDTASTTTSLPSGDTKIYIEDGVYKN